jgi:hypothetical protein
MDNVVVGKKWRRICENDVVDVGCCKWKAQPAAAAGNRLHQQEGARIPFVSGEEWD